MKNILIFLLFLCFFASAAIASDVVSRAKAARHVLLNYGPAVTCGDDSVVCTEKNFKKANGELVVSCEQNPDEFIFVSLGYEASESLGFDFERGPGIGLGTRFSILNPSGCVVLAVKRAVHNIRTREIEEAAYTSYSPEIDSEELREEGMNYLIGVISEAQSRLSEKEIQSRAFKGTPVVAPDSDGTILRLALIEHIDPDRARVESPDQLINEVLVTLALNREGAYKYARSPAGAHGLFQFTKPTYKLVLRKYPKADLNPDFISGAEDHVNSAMSALLLIDLDTASLSPRVKKLFLATATHHMEYSAAAYNGGSGRARRAMKKDGTLRVQRLFRETRAYIMKLRLVHEALD